ncbi:hypothetical protein DFA_07985 [Cavenderia fasciculata]|uniref:CYTH domain-containing protein n=1 Tax=Cavenderia fasciculata TaxID=261658 RepID=F4Q4E2_CACFS|nr:uncharacterized protein DFA_07985 [Cavenderia fasciculata]EGG17004.1 hypothetical protein DFA_07985 [Cavenderia fasciculata]|eukprot:XP_004355488.1 hypothetical protein DFA_07985 [Cavenderia fasciculata]
MSIVEVEIKFSFNEEIKQSIIERCTSFGGEKTFVDKYWDHPTLYSLSLSNIWLRQRDNRWELKIPPTQLQDINNNNNNNNNNNDYNSNLSTYQEIEDPKEILNVLVNLKYLSSSSSSSSSTFTSSSTSTPDEILKKRLEDSGMKEYATIKTIRTSYLLTIELDTFTVVFDQTEGSLNDYQVGELELLVEVPLTATDSEKQSAHKDANNKVLLLAKLLGVNQGDTNMKKQRAKIEDFTQAGLAAIASAQEKVCVVKSVNGQVSNVVWVTFKPFAQNQISWKEEYGLYASSTQIQNGATISRLSTLKAAAKGHQYPFNSSGFFDQADSVSVTSYGLVNNYGEPLTFGLTQSALINGVQVDSELNATTVLGNQTAEYTPIVTLSVFVQSQQNNGSVISSITSQSLTLTYTSDTTKAVFYDDNSNSFVEGNLPN